MLPSGGSVDELVEFCTQERFLYRHQWQVGDVFVWDNRCTLHTGTLYDDTQYIRVMHRLWARGDKPIAVGTPEEAALLAEYADMQPGD